MSIRPAYWPSFFPSESPAISTSTRYYRPQTCCCSRRTTTQCTYTRIVSPPFRGRQHQRHTPQISSVRCEIRAFRRALKAGANMQDAPTRERSRESLDILKNAVCPREERFCQASPSAILFRHYPVHRLLDRLDYNLWPSSIDWIAGPPPFFSGSPLF